MKLIKPKFWDKKKPNFLSYLLFPLTVIVRINNLIINNCKKVKYEGIKTICVGNIYIGGTGKTPLTIYLFNIINKINKRTVVAKKFYASHADEITLLKKYTNFIYGRNRLDLVEEALKRKFKIIIFDDGLQDKNIDYDLKFICFDASTWIGNGQLLPSGPLRQNIKVLKKFDAIFLKNIDKINKSAVHFIKSINPNIQIFNFSLKIKNEYRYDLKKKYLALSSIGNSDSFLDLLKLNKFQIIKHLKFPDHHIYDEIEIKNIINQAKVLNTIILTTEKDYVKIPKKYLNNFRCLRIDLHIDNKKSLLSYLEMRLNEKS